jgi:hypothetical protein
VLSTGPCSTTTTSRACWCAETERQTDAWEPDARAEHRAVLNHHDEPRVLVRGLTRKGRKSTARWEGIFKSRSCENATEDFRQFRHQHGFVAAPMQDQTVIFKLVPMFSPTKVRL